MKGKLLFKNNLETARAVLHSYKANHLHLAHITEEEKCSSIQNTLALIKGWLLLERKHKRNQS